ncbi:MAG: TetR/AcrR family transcriptional regulator [Sphingomonadales bacterium]|uniref:TetR/AcrR family transcriptional regulator n=1 Tax=Novosphingobium sp. NDB2Meth1 TaxID=1892847 RepID=UPI00092FE70A|nr:TetR/AcrR family transcriptional regulator [Novosphingobium sp. NDB2Meth1]MBU6393886.1 TetR/AcrR family transcriptional regulator [Sphingomonadales bacterium]MBY0393928.1 TetR/AcrR family transcriptional regulator [Novosphingobium sp.]
MKINPAVSEKRKAGRPTVDRRDEILDAAEQLYDAMGFEKVTVTDVARVLGMSPANLYRSFANRQAIDEAVTKRTLATVEDAAWQVARTAAADPIAAFRQLCSDIALKMSDILFRSGRASDLCLAATRGHWPPVRDFTDTLHGVIRHVIAEGQRQGVMRADLPLEQTSATVVSAMVKVWHPVMLDTFGVADLESETAALTRLVLNALQSEK